jgi:hypothetical protein
MACFQHLYALDSPSQPRFDDIKTKIALLASRHAFPWLQLMANKTLGTLSLLHLGGGARSNHDAFDLIEAHFIAPAIAELRRAG